MRWKLKYPERGETRQKSAFLFFPKTINGERRWLEFATWLEVYGELDDDMPESLGWGGSYWEAKEWIS
jgi:hypothetical protein